MQKSGHMVLVIGDFRRKLVSAKVCRLLVFCVFRARLIAYTARKLSFLPKPALKLKHLPGTYDELDLFWKLWLDWRHEGAPKMLEGRQKCLRWQGHNFSQNWSWKDSRYAGNSSRRDLFESGEFSMNPVSFPPPRQANVHK